MPNKEPRTVIVNIPREFKPLLDEEMNEKGYFAYPQLMDDILKEHFKGKKPKAGKEKTLVKGVIHSETES